MTEQRDRIRSIANSIKNPEERARRIYFGEKTFALRDNEGAEFDIKSRIADYFKCDYRNVVFCGSAHLGFSPSKDTNFSPSNSDLDVAIIDGYLFHEVWKNLVEYSRAFSDLTVFGSDPGAIQRASDLREMLSKRGVIHLHNLPFKGFFLADRHFLDDVSKRYASLFEKISVSFYISEYAFAWKQNSAIQDMLRI